MTCRGIVCPGRGKTLALIMEQINDFNNEFVVELYEEENYPADRDLLMDVSGRLDSFLERKLFKSLCVAVPLYFGAHLIKYLISK